MKKYDNYKDSGIEWIGEIPEHWEVSRIKFYIDYQKGKNPKELKYSESNESEIYLAMDYLRGNPKQMLYVEDVENYVKVDENDILLLWDGSNAGEFVLSKKGILSSTMAVLNLKNIQKEYSWYFFKHFEPQLKQSTIGMGVPHVNGEELKNGFIALPTPEEQTAIAHYLDRKTTEIDELIADKKRLLELYEEEKTAIINQAVTKGLPRKDGRPSVSMKDSGIEWLGEIPEHWQVKRLSWCFDIIGSGTTPKAGSEEYYFNGEFNWLLTGDLTDGDILETSKKVTQKALDDYSSLKKYPINSIVMAMYGATIGKLGILKIPTTVNQACCVLGNPIHLHYQFAFFLLLAARKEIINMSYGGGQPNISQELIKSFRVQVPPLEEQQYIVQYIETECALIDAKTKNTKKLIDLLTEYRTALISEVVTGKIKVV
jgi:type I restriction enzyme S subunit